MSDFEETPNPPWKFWRLLKYFAGVIVVIVILLGIGFLRAMYPKLKNMKSEYATVSTIGLMKDYIRTHDGKWPSSPEKFHGSSKQYVYIDYSVTAAELLADSERLRDVIRPASGKFYTYPHYDRELDSLLEVLQEMDDRSNK